MENYPSLLLYTYNKLIKQNFEASVQSLPHPMIEKTRRYRYREDAQRYLLGKLLLRHALNLFDLDLDLSNLKYTEHHRPYFEAPFDFNISHSEDLIVCVASKNERVGVDVEAIKKIEMDCYSGIFKDSIWRSILNSKKKLERFYYYWTLHEAVLKVQGNGLPSIAKLDFNNPDITYYEIVPWFTKEVHLRVGYKCHVASNAMDIRLQKKFIQL